MFSRDELLAIPVFSKLAERELDYLGSTSADIRVQPGEYVVHEGDPHRALYVAAEGRLDVTKFVDGVERPVGLRGPGDLFGEITVILNTPFLASLRARTFARRASRGQRLPYRSGGRAGSRRNHRSRCARSS